MKKVRLSRITVLTPLALNFMCGDLPPEPYVATSL